MKKKFGYMPCPDCGARVTVKRNEQETLSYTCDECDGVQYCRKAEGRYASWLTKIERADPPAAPAAAPTPAAAPGRQKYPHER